MDNKRIIKVAKRIRITNKIMAVRNVIDTVYGGDNVKADLAETSFGYDVIQYIQKNGTWQHLSTSHYEDLDKAQEKLNKIQNEY